VTDGGDDNDDDDDLTYLQTRLKHYRVLAVATCCMLSSGSEFYMLTFRNTLFHFHRQVGMKYTSYPPEYEDGTECSETSAYKIQMPGNYQKKEYSIQNTAEV